MCLCVRIRLSVLINWSFATEWLGAPSLGRKLDWSQRSGKHLWLCAVLRRKKKKKKRNVLTNSSKYLIGKVAFLFRHGFCQMSL